MAPAAESGILAPAGDVAEGLARPAFGPLAGPRRCVAPHYGFELVTHGLTLVHPGA